jgi:glycosyltransferase involved in cell wall biosynthesis
LVLTGGALLAVAPGRLPLVISLHGSDVYVAERHRLAGLSARRVFSRADWVTACSDDLRRRAVALGAEAGRTEVLPYGVDVTRFHPDPRARAVCRAALGIADEDAVLFTAGRLVRKKGFEYLIEAAAMLRDRSPSLQVLIAGAGDLERDLRARARAAGVAERVRFLGIVRQTEMPQYLAAADIIVVPSVRDEAGNVDGLPNVVMEALASGTPLVTTLAGGIGEVAAHDRNALVVPERDAAALGGAIERLLGDPPLRKRLGGQARQDARQEHGWERVAERFERAYERAQSRRPV